jgi:hypothetical protein
MDKANAKRDSTVRLLIGLLINLTLLKPAFAALESGLNLEIALFSGAAAVVTMILLARVLWRGVSWQQVPAVLLTTIPAILLFDVLRFWSSDY